MTTGNDDGKRPLVLKGTEWTDITKHLQPAEDTEQSKQRSKNAQYEQYLKVKSRAMTANWNNSTEKMVAKRNVDRIQAQREKFVTGQQLYQEMKEADRKNRKELLDYAHDMVQHLKAGPQQLENAFNLTELIEQQRLQREQRAETQDRDRLNYLAEGTKQMKQAQDWIQEQVEQTNIRTAQCLQYKGELANEIRLRDQQRRELKQSLLDEERAEQEKQMAQCQAILAEESQIIQRKKENVHRNSLESFRLNRQRQMRDAANNRTEDGKINHYLQAKNERETMRRLNERERKYRRARAVEELGVKVQRNLPDIEGAEERCYQKAIKELATQWDGQEQKRRAHTARLRTARVVHQSVEREESETQRQLQTQKVERAKEIRLKNDEISFHHEMQRRIERARRHHELQKMLSGQVEERKLRERMEITDDSKYFREENQKDDDHFMQYANKLLNYASNRGRNLRPLLKVIGEYQEKHALLPPTIELPHMHSQVGIGVAEKEFIVRTRKHGVQK